MIRDLFRFLRRLTTGLAFVATIVVGILPGGMLPKLAGRCGRDLCECPPEIQINTNRFDSDHQNSAKVCHVCLSTPVKLTRILTFSRQSISDSLAPNLAFQEVFIALEAHKPVVVTQYLEEMDSTAPNGSFFTISNTYRDILVPPPRA